MQYFYKNIILTSNFSENAQENCYDYKNQELNFKKLP